MLAFRFDFARRTISWPIVTRFHEHPVCLGVNDLQNRKIIVKYLTKEMLLNRRQYAGTSLRASEV